MTPAAATLAMTGILALALAAPAGSGAPVILTIIGLVVIVAYGIYETITATPSHDPSEDPDPSTTERD